MGKHVCGEAVRWNEFSRVVQCHVCGRTFVPRPADAVVLAVIVVWGALPALGLVVCLYLERAS